MYFCYNGALLYKLTAVKDHDEPLIRWTLLTKHKCCTNWTSSFFVYFFPGEKCIRCILKVVYACDKEVVILGTPVRGSPSQNRALSKGNSALIKTLKDVLYLFIADMVSIMNDEVRYVPVMCFYSLALDRF